MVKTLIIGLLIFFLIFWVLPRLIPRFLQWFIPWLVRRKMDKFVNSQQRQANSQAQDFYDIFERMRQQSADRASQRRHRNTVFDSSDGEYVEYEEIEATVTETRVSYDGDPEPQISDADWEEI